MAVHRAHPALLIYAAAMMPAWLAGRPWKELLLVVRLTERGFYHKLSMNAANLYAFAERLGLSYEVGVRVGLAIAAAAGLVIPMYAQRLQVDDAEAKLLVATASALLMPFLLPKMHDRFFFAADVFTFMLACALPRFWWLATAMQASSVAAYLGFLFGVHRGSYVGALSRSLRWPVWCGRSTSGLRPAVASRKPDCCNRRLRQLRRDDPIETIRHRQAKTQEQVDGAYGNEETVIPKGLTRPAHWSP